MELEFVAKAVRRFWPVVVAFTLLGMIAATLLSPSATTEYQSTALVLLRPGDDGTAGDRYVSSELVVLQSPPIAERAIELGQLGLSIAAVSESVQFIQIAGTDVVRIVSSSSSPTEAQKIANAFLDAYVEESESAGGDQIDDESIERLVTDLEQQLASVDVSINEVLAPFVEAAAAVPDGEFAEVPPIEELEPALAARREVLLEQYKDALRQREGNAIVSGAGDRVIQRAEVPSQSLATSSKQLTFAISIGGFLLGIAAATVLARSSKFVLDDAEVVGILGRPMATVVPRARSLQSGSLERLINLPEPVRRSINDLCVQVEAQSAGVPGSSIVVTGTRRLAGTTTVAAAMAANYAALGARVLLIDFDAENPEITKFFGAKADGFDGLIESTQPVGDSGIFTPSGIANLAVVGGRSVGSRPSRPELRVGLDAACLRADVVIFDAGPMLATSAAAILARQADAVVLTIPVRRQLRSSLETVARQLAGDGTNLFPVAVPSLRRRPDESVEPPSSSLESDDDDDDDDVDAPETASQLTDRSASRSAS